jgi:hypothetical protein
MGEGEMKIKEVEAYLTYYVEIEEEEGEDFDFHHYRTNESGSHWEVYMGDSWEPVEISEELRTKFLDFMRRQG